MEQKLLHFVDAFHQYVMDRVRTFFFEYNSIMFITDCECVITCIDVLFENKHILPSFPNMPNSNDACILVTCFEYCPTVNSTIKYWYIAHCISNYKTAPQMKVNLEKLEASSNSLLLVIPGIPQCVAWALWRHGSSSVTWWSDGSSWGLFAFYATPMFCSSR